jgi:hypothetical protein
VDEFGQVVDVLASDRRDLAVADGQANRRIEVERPR